jgi:hypothetical protein
VGQWYGGGSKRKGTASLTGHRAIGCSGQVPN